MFPEKINQMPSGVIVEGLDGGGGPQNRYSIQ